MPLYRKKINMVLSKKILKKSKIPVLVNDDNWKKITSKNSSLKLKFLREKLNKVMKEENAYKVEQQNIKKEKQVLLKEILIFSDLINTGEDEEAHDKITCKIDDNKEKISALNKKLESVCLSLENTPMKIEKINLNLLIETIKISYKALNESLAKLDKTNREVSRIRGILDALREEKEIHENNADLYYSFLHGMLGHEEMERLDIKLLQVYNETKSDIE